MIAALLLPAAMCAQTPEAGTIILPPHHDPDRPYPVIVMLPAIKSKREDVFHEEEA